MGHHKELYTALTFNMTDNLTAYKSEFRGLNANANSCVRMSQRAMHHTVAVSQSVCVGE